MIELHEQIETLLAGGQPREIVLEQSLRLILARFHSETGTIHRLDGENHLLYLAAQAGLPPPMLEIVKTIPVGKGIAGQVVAQNKPVTMCNLQTDTSGVAKPGAKQTGVGGALCVPIRNGEKIIGTLGRAVAHRTRSERKTVRHKQGAATRLHTLREQRSRAE